MADIQIWALRSASTKLLIGWAMDQFQTQAGQEQLQVTIDEADFVRFNVKYRFNSSSGELEINGKTFYKLQITEDAIKHNPITGVPQLDAGEADYLTLSIQKEDIDGVDQTDASDDDRIYLTFIGGDAALEFIDLVNGAASGQIHASTAKGVVRIAAVSEDIADAQFVVETV